MGIVSFHPVNLNEIPFGIGEKKCVLCQDAVTSPKGLAHDISINGNNIQHLFHKACFKEHLRSSAVNPDIKRITCSFCGNRVNLASVFNQATLNKLKQECEDKYSLEKRKLYLIMISSIFLTAMCFNDTFFLRNEWKMAYLSIGVYCVVSLAAAAVESGKISDSHCVYILAGLINYIGFIGFRALLLPVGPEILSIILASTIAGSLTSAMIDEKKVSLEKFH